MDIAGDVLAFGLVSFEVCNLGIKGLRWFEVLGPLGIWVPLVEERHRSEAALRPVFLVQKVLDEDDLISSTMFWGNGRPLTLSPAKV